MGGAARLGGVAHRSFQRPGDADPDCWWRHGGLVEELSALHTSWVAAYDTVDAGYGPIGWLERFQTAIERWRTGTHYRGSCSVSIRMRSLPARRSSRADFERVPRS